MSAVLQEQLPLSFFPAKVDGQSYGLFGYEGSMCDLAIWHDNADQIEEAFKRGWIAPGTETFDGMKLVKAARKRGSEKVAQRLIKLGWTDEKWPHPPQTTITWGFSGKVDAVK